MVQEADRLNRVITDLLFLAKPRQLSCNFLTLSDILRELRTLLGMDLETKQCRLEENLEAGSLHADRDALKQALINLIVNSLEAIPKAGGLIRLTSESGAHGVWIRVQDNGRGMTPAEQEHALEPFFTTRDHGTGLGLAIVHGIMQEHGGSVSIASTPNQGTTVSLFFPQPAENLA